MRHAVSGVVTATLLSGANTIDTATQTVTVSIRPSIQFSGLVRTITEGASDDFALVANDLDSSTTYTIRVTTDSSNIGFIDDCTDQQEDPAVPANIPSHTTSTITLYGCATTGGTVTATLSSGGNTIDTATQTVTVRPASTRRIGLFDFYPFYKVGAGHSPFEVSVAQLDPSKNYKILITMADNLDEKGGSDIEISFDRGCSEQEKEVIVPADSTSFTGHYHLEACDATRGTVTVKLFLADDTLVATETHHVGVFEDVRLRLGSRLGSKVSSMRVGGSDELWMAVNGLDSTRTYTVQIKTDETGALFDENCTANNNVKTFTLTGKTSYSISDDDFTGADTLYGCSAKRGTMRVNVYRGSTVTLNAHRWGFLTVNVRNP